MRAAALSVFASCAAAALDGSSFAAFQSRGSGRAAAVPTGTFSLAKLFGDHMVLQHDTPAVVWGFDTPGSTVTVGINGGSSYSNATDNTGLWRVTLAAHGMGGPHELDVTSTSGGAATILDVMFGSVYICGGQSNMQRVWGRAARRERSSTL